MTIRACPACGRKPGLPPGFVQYPRGTAEARLDDETGSDASAPSQPNRINFLPTDEFGAIALEIIIWAKETPLDKTSVMHLRSILMDKFADQGGRNAL